MKVWLWAKESGAEPRWGRRQMEEGSERKRDRERETGREKRRRINVLGVAKVSHDNTGRK